ncbi:hypothetical protein QBC46DRAFT_354340 [Diplogelasinospora grovesii]|uniref:Uncharacterized protein n=1 Tax=Diplogelasinospora grovesii TaxID=303347 RepID=A0AAN6NAH3_9PEZI|nr:hypothetical protein QBC46DRAFT_354340 [Diplogelasinospora grovesii]
MSVVASLPRQSSGSLTPKPVVHGGRSPKDETEKERADMQQDTGAEETKAPEYITGLPFGLVILSIFLVTFLTLLDTSIIATSVFLSISNTILDQSLRAQLGSLAERVLAVGATEFRDVVSPQSLPAVVDAYSTSVDRVFYLAAGIGATSVIVAQGMGWADVRKKKPVPSPDENNLGRKDLESPP